MEKYDWDSLGLKYNQWALNNGKNLVGDGLKVRKKKKKKKKNFSFLLGFLLLTYQQQEMLQVIAAAHNDKKLKQKAQECIKVPSPSLPPSFPLF